MMNISFGQQTASYFTVLKHSSLFSDGILKLNSSNHSLNNDRGFTGQRSAGGRLVS
jgi:hypothetical protein